MDTSDDEKWEDFFGKLELFLFHISFNNQSSIKKGRFKHFSHVMHNSRGIAHNFCNFPCFPLFVRWLNFSFNSFFSLFIVFRAYFSSLLPQYLLVTLREKVSIFFFFWSPLYFLFTLRMAMLCWLFLDMNRYFCSHKWVKKT